MAKHDNNVHSPTKREIKDHQRVLKDLGKSYQNEVFSKVKPDGKYGSKTDAADALFVDFLPEVGPAHGIGNINEDSFRDIAHAARQLRDDIKGKTFPLPRPRLPINDTVVEQTPLTIASPSPLIEKPSAPLIVPQPVAPPNPSPDINYPAKSSPPNSVAAVAPPPQTAKILEEKETASFLKSFYPPIADPDDAAHPFTDANQVPASKIGQTSIPKDSDYTKLSNKDKELINMRINYIFNENKGIHEELKRNPDGIYTIVNWNRMRLSEPHEFAYLMNNRGIELRDSAKSIDKVRPLPTPPIPGVVSRAP